MRTHSLLRMLWAAALVGFLTGGCRCSRDAAVDDGPEINKKPIIEEEPEAPRPGVLFPSHLRQPDPTLNAFVEQVLTICYQGDYDAFRQLFGTSYQPTGEVEFRRVWHGVRSVEVIRIQAGPQKEPHYYLLAKVQLRAPDRRGRRERSVPVMVYKEGGQWRVGPPPQGVIDELRALETQPASGPATRPGSATGAS